MKPSRVERGEITQWWTLSAEEMQRQLVEIAALVALPERFRLMSLKMDAAGPTVVASVADEDHLLTDLVIDLVVGRCVAIEDGTGRRDDGAGVFAALADIAAQVAA